MVKKKLIVFDMDGVLFDSISNMKVSWQYTNNIFKLNIDFKEYVKYLGLPFVIILNKLGIKSNQLEIQKNYKLASEKNLDLIIPFKKVLDTLVLLSKYKIKTAICTSKDLGRTKKILAKYNLKFDAIEAHTSYKKKGKPYPYQILNIINQLGVEKKNAVYIGDTMTDYLTAKNAKIDYLHAGWGYSKIKKNVIVLKSINEIIDFVDKK